MYFPKGLFHKKTEVDEVEAKVTLGFSKGYGKSRFYSCWSWKKAAYTFSFRSFSFFLMIRTLESEEQQAAKQKPKQVAEQPPPHTQKHNFKGKKKTQKFV